MLLLLCQCGSKPRFCITFETNAQMKKTTKVRLIYALLISQIVNRNGSPMKIGLKKAAVKNYRGNNPGI